MTGIFDVLPRYGAAAHRAGAGGLQVLVRALDLRRDAAGGLGVTVVIREDDPVLLGPDDRRRARALLDPEEGRDAAARIDALRRDGAAGETLRIRCERFGFRHVSGGVLALAGDDALLFFRDIEPAGWNIANGASGDAGELLDVLALGAREAAEELLFHDVANRRLLALPAPRLSSEARRARSLWAARLGLDDEACTLPAPARAAGLDALRVTLPDGTSRTTDGLMIEIQAEDFSIECARALALDLPPDAIPLDGELGGTDLLDRVVARVPRAAHTAAAPRARRAWRSGRPTAPCAAPLCPITARLLRRLTP